MPQSYEKIKRVGPNSALGWLDRWAQERIIWVQRKNYGETALLIKDIYVLSPCEKFGNPDLYIKTVNGKEFYVLFRKSNTFHAMDMPVLAWPPGEGLREAFWLMPVGWVTQGKM